VWHPPQKVRWPPPETRWPSAAEAARSRWFSPVALGPLALEQRTWVPAMVPWRATDDGVVTPDVKLAKEGYRRLLAPRWRSS
jgi:hypothetical protein